MIEEYIEGQDIYAFVFKYENNIIVYSALEKVEKEKRRYGETEEDEERKKIKNKKYIRNNKDVEKEVKEESKRFFDSFGFEKFVFIHYKKHQQRGLYFLNAFVDYRILDKRRRNILESIFKNEDLSFEKFIKKIIF